MTQEKANESVLTEEAGDVTVFRLIYFQRQTVFHLSDLNMLAQITQLSLQG